jgi:hypothetical protein
MKHSREQGRTGLVAEFHTYDRAVESAMYSILRKFATMYQEQQWDSMDVGVWYQQLLTQWLEIAGCFAHDLNGSLNGGFVATDAGQNDAALQLLGHGVGA